MYPKTETTRAKRRNGAAYQHRRLRSLTGGHSLAVITHGRRMDSEYQRSHSMFLAHEFAGTVGTSWSDRASLPRKRARAENAISHRIKKAKQDGGRIKESNSGEALLAGLLSDSHRTQNTKPTSAPTSTRDEPMSALCGETPYTLRSTLEFLERSPKPWFGGLEVYFPSI
jgi:hypothetical protein